MISREILSGLADDLGQFPAVALLGPRQAGKTTLALEVGRQWVGNHLPEQPAALYLDLESEQDRAKLSEPELYLGAHSDRLVILDEVHRAPGLFPVLRGLIDRSRRNGRLAGQYLLLGSASLDLLRQSGETLAGRIAYRELTPFTVLEIPPAQHDDLWLRGGFPLSLLASDTVQSLRWRQDFIRTYLEREIPGFGARIAAETLRRFWIMLAHQQGGLLNVAQLAGSLGIDVKTVNRYLDLLVDLFLVRRLPPWQANIGKRMVKSPKVYVRDSGLVHALLGIADKEALLAHPVVGASWEGFAVEHLLASAGQRAEAYFYRTGAGAEIDLLLVWPDGSLWAVEVKHTLAPRVERGFHNACADLLPVKKFIVYPGAERYPLAQNIEAIPLALLAAEVTQHGR
jgi:hypothetical protein